MPVQQLQDQTYSLKGATQCSDQYGIAKRNLLVLAGTADGFSIAGTPNHAQVVLKEGSGASATPIAYFSAAQARQLADALNAAAGANGDDLKADC